APLSEHAGTLLHRLLAVHKKLGVGGNDIHNGPASHKAEETKTHHEAAPPGGSRIGTLARVEAPVKSANEADGSAARSRGVLTAWIECHGGAQGNANVRSCGDGSILWSKHALNKLKLALSLGLEIFLENLEALLKVFAIAVVVENSTSSKSAKLSR